MKFPATERELTDGGYVASGTSRCQGSACQTWLYWYLTPKGKRMPLSKVINNPGPVYEPHFLVCISAKEFRRKKA